MAGKLMVTFGGRPLVLYHVGLLVGLLECPHDIQRASLGTGFLLVM